MTSQIKSPSDPTSQPEKHVRISYTAVAVNLEHSSNYIVISLDDKSVRVFDVEGKALHVLRHKTVVWSLALRDDMLVCGEVGGDILSWDLGSGLTKNIFIGHQGTVRCLTFCSPTSFVSAARDGMLKIWSLEAEQGSDLCVKTLGAHTADIVSLAFDPASDFLASGSKNGTCRIWKLADQVTSISALSGHKGVVWRMAFIAASENDSRALTRVVTGGLDGQVKVWDTASGVLIADLEGHTGLVTHVLAIANDSQEVKTLVTVGVDGAIKAWEMSSTPRLLWAQKKAHVNGVNSVHSDGEYLISGGADNQVKVWEVQTGRMVKKLGEKFDAIYGVACKKGGGQGFIVVSKQNASLVLEMF